MTGHIVSAYEEELRDLTARISEMGGLVEHQMADAISSLLKGDREKAERVISVDDRVDELDSTTEEKAILIIAKRQPMGDDLRTIVAAMRISQDLERVGDLAKNIAKRALAIEGIVPTKQLILGVEHLSSLAMEQLRSALDAFISRDATLAENVRERDDEIDALYTSMFRELLTYMMEDTRNITLCTHLLFCAKNIERIGDHATNIAEQIHYIVTGQRMTEERPKNDTSSFTVVEGTA
jgi:phosphate transport system protein